MNHLYTREFESNYDVRIGSNDEIGWIVKGSVVQADELGHGSNPAFCLAVNNFK